MAYHRHKSHPEKQEVPPLQHYRSIKCVTCVSPRTKTTPTRYSSAVGCDHRPIVIAHASMIFCSSCTA